MKAWKKKKSYIAALCSILMFSFVLSACGSRSVDTSDGENLQIIDEESAKAGSATDEMQVHFIDVGQGDSSLVICGEHAMLIDTGDDSKGTTVQNYIQKRGIKELDYLILTHPDKDHIGGAPVVITKFDIDQVFMSNYEKDTKIYQKVIQALDYKNLKYTTPKVGTKYPLGSAEFTIIAPNGDYSKSDDESNNSSVGILLENGDNRFLFTGDAEEEAERDIVKNGIDITADVYQVGHHGSKTSSSIKLLNAAGPTYAVISCEEGNENGHPHAQTLNNFRQMGIKVYRTDEQGSIVATSDGSKITWNCAPSTTWKAGEGTKSSDKKTEDAKKSNTQKAGSDKSSIQQSNDTSDKATTQSGNYVLNTKSKKFHLPTCSKLPTKNRQDTDMTREEIIAQGYDPCKICDP